MPRSPPRDHYQLKIWRIASTGLPLVKIICMKNNMESVRDSTFEVRFRGKTHYRRSRDFQCPLPPVRYRPLLLMRVPPVHHQRRAIKAFPEEARIGFVLQPVRHVTVPVRDHAIGRNSGVPFNC